MKIIVCGCGKIGSAIIEKLSEEGHDVIVIDKEQAVVTEIANSRNGWRTRTVMRH